jgi:hypothetical protein
MKPESADRYDGAGDMLSDACTHTVLRTAASSFEAVVVASSYFCVCRDDDDIDDYNYNVLTMKYATINIVYPIYYISYSYELS